MLLDQLRLFGIHERLDQRIDHYLQTSSPYEIYGKVIARREQDYGAGTALVPDTLALLWAARRGLSEAELLDALGPDGKPMPRAAWSPLFLAMSEAVVSRGGLLTFAHDFLRTAARDAALPTESRQRQAHERLADYFHAQPSGARRTDELPWQLAEAHAWQRLHDLLIERVFFAAAWDRNQFEVKTYWTQIESGSPLRMVSAYGAQIEHPEEEGDQIFLDSLSLLLTATGHPEEALQLHASSVDHFPSDGNLGSLQAMLNNQVHVLFHNRNEPRTALPMCEETISILTETGMAPDVLKQAQEMRTQIQAKS